ncbi:RimK family alpha-L-glutamate ligase [Streptomyces sp. NPDC058657]|uniref:ATP-grasp domain-containing protein n=1 Tax=unclassified Streptomyces TaxID=2593676 RepID=UPI003665B156
MRIALITPDPGHPLLAATAGLLTPEHEVVSIDPASVADDDPASVAEDGRASVPEDGPAAANGFPGRPLADVYLLKSRTPQALALAHRLERRGARVVNGAAATALLQDRTTMAERALRAGLPFAPTRTYPSLTALAAGPPLRGPVVVKSRRSAKGDLVARVESLVQLRELAATRDDAHAPVVVQDFAPNDGWDHKTWAIEDHLFAALRRSELSEGGGHGPAQFRPDGQLPTSWVELVRKAGEVFGLEVYGVDFVAVQGSEGAATPLIVDINAFPGIRDQPGAPEALAALVLRGRG